MMNREPGKQEITIQGIENNGVLNFGLNIQVGVTLCAHPPTNTSTTTTEAQRSSNDNSKEEYVDTANTDATDVCVTTEDTCVGAGEFDEVLQQID